MLVAFFLNFFYTINENSCDFNGCSSLKYICQKELYPTYYKYNYTFNLSGGFFYVRQYDYFNFYNLHNESFLFKNQYDTLTNNICYFMCLLEHLNTAPNLVDQYSHLLVYFSDILTKHIGLGYNIGQCIYIDSYILTTLSLIRMCHHQFAVELFDTFITNLSVLEELRFDKKIFLYQGNHNIESTIQNCKLYLNSNQSFNSINNLINENWSKKDFNTKYNILFSPDYINKPITFDSEFSHKHTEFTNYKFGPILILCMGFLSATTIMYNTY